MSAKTEWRSSVMRCNIGEDQHDPCPVCSYLCGNRRPEIVYRVIKVLDAALDDSERSERSLLQKLAERSNA